MAAGHSAANEGARQRLLADQHEYAASTAREMASNYEAAAATEARLARMLEPLESSGYRVLADRLWPGSSKANIDFVLVGPTGVFIVDAKSWGDISVDNGRVFQGQDDVTDRLMHIAGLGGVVEHALGEIGLVPAEVRVAAVFMGASGIGSPGKPGRAAGVDLVSEKDAVRYLLSRGERLNPAQVRSVLSVIESLFVPYAGQFQPVELTMPSPVIPTTLESARITADDIERALMAGILLRPIEDWMSWLHPDQARLVRRSFNGPSRIRGAAGTGKTVVGLHRAAYLARTKPGTVLVTTLVRTLPDVLSSLLERMAPDVTDRVEFRGIHSFAMKVLKDRGVKHAVDPAKADAAFKAAWNARDKKTDLAKIDKNMDYSKDEVICVLKGRGITEFEQYAGLARVGRRRGLTTDQRHAVWELHTAYDAQLRKQGIHDFADVILLAEKSLREKPLDGYSAVVVDEAQDLSCSMIRMLHAVVGDSPDGLNLIGDGQQTIYPGGYTLSEANVSIAGRGVIMTRNYRNTVEIAALASLLVAGDEFIDIEGESITADRVSDVFRHGSEPAVARFASNSGHDESLIAHVKMLIDSGTPSGDIGILSATNFGVKDVMAALTKAGIDSIDLSSYAGVTTDAVKVGTIKRAKGLEFKQVLVARTPARLLDEGRSSLEDVAASERLELDRRELYVAMTRARDGLWVGVS